MTANYIYSSDGTHIHVNVRFASTTDGINVLGTDLAKCSFTCTGNYRISALHIIHYYSYY